MDGELKNMKLNINQLAAFQVCTGRLLPPEWRMFLLHQAVMKRKNCIS